MPEMDGVTFLQRFGAVQPGAGRLIVSGCADREALRDALNVAHIHGYVEKPWNAEQLRGIVETALTHHDRTTRSDDFDADVKEQNAVIEEQARLLEYVRRHHPDVWLRALANRDLV